MQAEGLEVEPNAHGTLGQDCGIMALVSYYPGQRFRIRMSSWVLCWQEELPRVPLGAPPFL